MAVATLELTVMAAEELKNVSTFGKMDLYAVAWVDPAAKRSTRVIHKAGRNPVWNDCVSLSLENYLRYYPNSYLTVEIFSEANLGDKVVGTGRLALHEIYRLTSRGGDEPALVTLQLQRPSGRPQGFIRLAMKVRGDATRAAVVPDYPVDKNADVVEGIPVMGIPVGGPYAVAPNFYEHRGDGTTATGYPSLLADSSHSGSTSVSSDNIPYAYPPAYHGYPRSYGYAAPAPAGYPQPVYQQGPYAYVQPPQPQQRTSGGGLLLGILGGALGGLILGDILT
ncbi:hypothetical protein MPTK1_5g03770 [Marchantia polymorpha subsp. ruderalis]|uniref:C2 domain-containing protein n=2 Tax=Marchantia polymorpha TaxID=3197 RepID=A0AAF6BEN0_MARPO|nr:hypothetical protein MARPO_0133s0012 [Marchantia polymorpha]BBN10464.1 hypothetical protein Mp_5g03770 [Marchantia polymorpha subsp. ruderalis]|eukprot:PTQ29862.1 hypothetical protein MARPO_0133s0012 [Marchantia polymorpha]